MARPIVMTIKEFENAINSRMFREGREVNLLDNVNMELLRYL